MYKRQKAGFRKIAEASFYRKADNLGVFDAHDKNVLRQAEGSSDLIPFDVIPTHPDEGLLDFIRKTLDENNSLRAERITRTRSRTT